MIRAESSSPQKRSGGLGRVVNTSRTVVGGRSSVDRGAPETPWRSRRKYETRGASHPSSRFYPQRTEPSVSLHHVRIREASNHKCFCQPLVRLPRIGRKAKRNSGAGLHDPSHFSQTNGRIRPDLHGVNRQRLIKAVVIEWQANHGATPPGRHDRSGWRSCSERELARPSHATDQSPRHALLTPASTGVE